MFPFNDFIIHVLYIVELNVINHDKFPTFQYNEYFPRVLWI